MRKLSFRVIHPDYGYQGTFVSNTKANAIKLAEAEWLNNAMSCWEPGLVDDDGNEIPKPVPPTFTATKVKP